MNKDQTVVEYVVPSRKNASVNVVLKTSSGDVVNTVSYKGNVGDTVRFDNLKGEYYASGTKLLTEVPEPIVLKDTNEDIVVVLEDKIRENSIHDIIRPYIDTIGMTDHLTFENVGNRYLLKSSLDKPEGTFYPLLWYGKIPDIKNDYLVNGARFYMWAVGKGKLDYHIMIDQESSSNWGDLRAEDLLYGTPKEYDTPNDLTITYDVNARTDEHTFKDVTIHNPRTKIEIPILKDYDLYYIPQQPRAFTSHGDVTGVFDVVADNKLVKIEKPLSFWNRPSDEKIKVVLDAHKNEKFASFRDMIDALTKLMYTEDDIGLSEYLINELFKPRSDTMQLAYVPSEHTIHAKIVNERGEVLKDVPVTGRGNDVVDISWGSLSELETLYDLSDVPTTHHIPLHGAQDITFVVKDKEDAYKVNWKVYDGYDESNLLHQGTVTGKYGEKLSDKLDLSQYHLDEASKNRLNDYRFGVDSLTGGTSPQTVDYSFYSRKDVTGEVTFKDVFGREIHQAIAYQGKSQDKLSDETIEQMRQVLLANKETHPNVRITINNGSMPEHVYTDVDTFLNDLPNLRLGDEASNIQVQYGVTVTKTYPFKVQSSFTRLLVPEGLESLAERHHSYEDGRRIRYTHDYYSPTDGKLYDAFLPYVSGQNEYDLYKNDGKVFMFLESVSSTDFDNLTYGLEMLGLDTSSVQMNPTTTATYPLILTMQIDPLGNVSVSNVEMGEVESDKPLSVRFLPGFDTYYLGGGGISALLDSIYKHEVDVDSLKFANTFNYQIGTQLSSEDITKLMNAFGDMGKLDENNEASLDNKINRVLDEYKYRVGIMIPWYAEKVTGEEAKEWLDGKHYMNSSPILLVTPKTYQNKVKIVNDAGEILAEKDLSAKYKDTVNYDMTDAFKALEDKYITSDDLSGNWTAATENQDIIIHAKERFIKNTETKQVKRIVRFHDGQKVVGEEEQVVTFTRTVKKEVLTGELTYSDWTSDHPQFDEIAVPTKEDKTANVQSVPEKAVTVEDKDEIVDVYYGPKMVDGDTQTKATIHVTYKYQDGTIYKEFDVQADRGSILDGSDLEMLPDNMDFADDFMFYEVKGDGHDSITRVVKKNVTDNGSQTDAPSTSDNGVQTDAPSTSDNGTQTDNPSTSDNGSQTDTPSTSDNGTQTDTPSTSDGETQTSVQVKVTYKYADGTIYRTFTIDAESGSILDGSDLEMLPDDMEFDDDFMFYPVKGGGSDSITRIVKKLVTDNGTQTDTPSTSDNGTQTDKPSSSDNGTQTDTPSTSDNGTQTDKPSTSDNGNQTDPNEAHVTIQYVTESGKVIQSFEVIKRPGEKLTTSDLQVPITGYKFTTSDKDLIDMQMQDGHLVLSLRVQPASPKSDDNQKASNMNNKANVTPSTEMNSDNSVKVIKRASNNLPVETTTQYKGTLPTTGAKDSATQSMIGASLLALGGMFGLSKISKRKRS